MVRSWFYLLILSLLIIIGLLLLLAGSHKQLNIHLDEEPNLIIYQLQMMQFNKEGVKEYLITSPSLSQFGWSMEEIRINQPILNWYRPVSNTNWQFCAGRGLITIDKHIILDQGVLVSSNNGNQIYTSNIIIKPEKQSVETTAQINIFTHNATIKSLGMYIDLQLEKLELFSKVQGSYVP